MRASLFASAQVALLWLLRPCTSPFPSVRAEEHRRKADHGRALFERSEFARTPLCAAHRRLQLLGSDTHFTAVRSTAPSGEPQAR